MDIDKLKEIGWCIGNGDVWKSMNSQIMIDWLRNISEDSNFYVQLHYQLVIPDDERDMVNDYMCSIMQDKLSHIGSYVSTKCSIPLEVECSVIASSETDFSLVVPIIEVEDKLRKKYMDENDMFFQQDLSELRVGRYKRAEIYFVDSMDGFLSEENSVKIFTTFPSISNGHHKLWIDKEVMQSEIYNLECVIANYL